MLSSSSEGAIVQAVPIAFAPVPLGDRKFHHIFFHFLTLPLHISLVWFYKQTLHQSSLTNRVCDPLLIIVHCMKENILFIIYYSKIFCPILNHFEEAKMVLDCCECSSNLRTIRNFILIQLFQGRQKHDMCISCTHSRKFNRKCF